MIKNYCNIKKPAIVFTFLFFLFYVSSAQNYERNWGINVDYGSIEYRGELGDQFWDLGQWQGGYGVEVSRYLSPLFNFGLRGGYNFLSVWTPDSAYSMTGDMFTAMGNIEIKLANGITMSEDAVIKPYVKLGAGKMFGDTWGKSMDDDGNRFNKHLNDWIYSVGGGLKIKLTDHINAYAEVGNLWVTAVGMDGSRSDPQQDQFIKLNIGLSVSLGSFKDTDRDGVADKHDECPNTPPDVEVDQAGCPLDADGDGIPDYRDECMYEPGTEQTKGCPDTDGDGLADKYDACPEEPGPISNKGCPIEEKEKEKSEESGGANTQAAPQGVSAGGVNIFFVYPGANGQMPQIYSTNTGGGMINDRDNDGIADNIDNCPDQPGSLSNAGCPDAQSQVASNTYSAFSNISGGCPNDIDCDGISDQFDKCPDQPGSIRNKGCPIEHLSPKWRKEYSINPVHFVTGKSFLTDYSRAHVDKLIETMMNNPELNVWLFGHTDARGSEDFNARLSEDRLRTIVNYMTSKGIDKDRIYTMAFGESFPAALGTQPEELKKNRRVDFYLFEFQ